MKTQEFWSELVTKASWEKLLEISKRFNFIVIGGWAAYLWTKAHKSKDIDIVVDYSELDALRSEFDIAKNERLRKYEIRQEGFDIDIYLGHWSRLAVPVEALSRHTAKVEGIRTIIPELLVILKQGAEIDRRGSIKGKKDQIDILTLLIYSDFKLRKYRAFLKEFGLERFEPELRRVVHSFDERELVYLGMDHQQFVKWKRNFLEALKSP
ncbi:hypothetical protein H0O00_02700 [Candidatus Micrarchaeota archaeon]|nr:hypothetical protein [Candidatus Micrarchaeota archaeon]